MSEPAFVACGVCPDFGRCAAESACLHTEIWFKPAEAEPLPGRAHLAEVGLVEAAPVSETKP